MQGDTSLREIIIVGVGSAGLIWYYVSLFTLGLKPAAADTPSTTFRQFMSLSVTSIGVTLATFMGMLLGIRTISNAVKEEVGQATANAIAPAASQIQQLASGALTTNLQWWAAGFYILSLVIALVFWYRGGDATDPAVSNLGKSLLGLVAGALAIALNLPQ